MIQPGTPPKCANATRWQAQNVPRSWLVVKQQNGSREYGNVMWNEETDRTPSAAAIAAS
ncbi:MAG: hypothetical protein JWN35_1771 [Frankiales bacterium]|jgi:hypothetical protein|nr:hypothetical protein [Frankiales bacterium]